MGLTRITREDLPRYQGELSALEKLMTYPIGNDRFRIDHGPDYFRFFERLGKLYYYANVDGGRILGCGAGMLRTLPFHDGGKPRKCWYAGDAKVHPDHRGKNMALWASTRLFLPNFLRCPRGYAVSMNPGDGSPNPIVTYAHKYRWASVRASAVLELYSLDADQMRACEPIVREHRGPLSYLSLSGIKDIVLESTGKPMPLLHVQFGACAETGQAAPEPGHTHMFVTPEKDPLATAVRARGWSPSATATVISSGMSDSDWRFVLTSDI